MTATGSRFGRFLKSSVNSLLQPAEDPRKQFSSPEAERQLMLAQVRQAASRLSETRERLERQRAEVKAAIEQLESEARVSLRSGQDSPARLALRRQQLKLSEAVQLDNQIAGLRREEVRLSDIEQRVTAQVETIRAREEMAAARHSAARAQVAAGEALSGIGLLADETRLIERIEHEAEKLEARAEAIEELTGAGFFDDGLKEFEEVPRSGREPLNNQEVEERLRQLKTELSLL